MCSYKIVGLGKPRRAPVLDLYPGCGFSFLLLSSTLVLAFLLRKPGIQVYSPPDYKETKKPGSPSAFGAWVVVTAFVVGCDFKSPVGDCITQIQ